MTTVWGIHMPEEIGADAVEKSRVSIGWPLLGMCCQRNFG